MLERTETSLNLMADRLSQSEIFKDLCQPDLMSIAAFCHEEFFEDDAPILKEGEPADKLFIVQRGKIALEKKVQLGRHSTPRNATIPSQEHHTSPVNHVDGLIVRSSRNKNVTQASEPAGADRCEPTPASPHIRTQPRGRRRLLQQ